MAPQSFGWTQIDERTWRYDEQGVRFFLVAGSERAALIDSGMMTHDARELAAEVCDLPLLLLHTHCDIDHVGSDAEFDEVWLSPMELVHPQAPRYSPRVKPLWDGDIVELGGRTLEVIAMPGHTPGSLAFLDTEAGMLFSGDPIQRNGRIFMFGPLRSLAAYIHSLERLQARSDDIDTIWPCHADCPIDTSVIGELIEGARAVELGAVRHTMGEMHGKPIREYDVGVAVLLCDAE